MKNSYFIELKKKLFVIYIIFKLIAIFQYVQVIRWKYGNTTGGVFEKDEIYSRKDLRI